MNEVSFYIKEEWRRGMSGVEGVQSMNRSEWIADKSVTQNGVSFLDLHIKKRNI